MHLSSFTKVRVKFKNSLYEVSDLFTGQSIFIAKRQRLHLYLDGVGCRLIDLGEQYLLDHSTLDPTGWIIDVGANVGEFSMILQRAGFQNILTVEPEEQEASCADKNIHGGQLKTVRKALWEFTGEVDFYQPNETGDSSTFPNNLSWPKIRKDCVTLDDLVLDYGISKITCLKLEAEGAEPEVLRGATLAMGITQYILADLGSERGPQEESTFLETNEILVENGFELIEKGGKGFRESFKYFKVIEETPKQKSQLNNSAPNLIRDFLMLGSKILDSKNVP